MDAREPRRTVALVGTLLIFAYAIAADLWLQHAFIHIVGTVPTCPSPLTLALEVPIGQVEALSAILAGLCGALIAHLVLWANALVLSTDHWLLAIEWRTVLCLLAAISRVANGTVTMSAIHGTGASIQALAICGVAVDGRQGQSGGAIARALLAVVT